MDPATATSCAACGATFACQEAMCPSCRGAFDSERCLAQLQAVREANAFLLSPAAAKADALELKKRLEAVHREAKEARVPHHVDMVTLLPPA